jgi:DNA helicase II / ATP-dependent DNA helicase PcrA
MLEGTHPDPYQEEQSKLRQTLLTIDTQFHKLQTIPRYYGDDLVEQALDEIRIRQMHNLEISKAQPFFGRLDFQELDNNHIQPLYIGKVGLKDGQTEDVLVTDWRAPVSSLFYSFTGVSDEASYDSPDGLVEGRVHLKRNIAIRNHALERVVDSYVRGSDNLGVTDEYLLYRLEEKKDNRLRDIVSTIQAEQDHIIRAERNKALVIQGVAGSGKTTVALHRIAYMLYQYQDRVRPEKMIIFAPNRMFLDYISDVLPELGVGGIQQTTFVDWAKVWLPLEVRLREPADRTDSWFDPTHASTPAWVADVQYKGSMKFMEDIRTFLDEFEQSFVPAGDFQAWEGQVLREETVRQWFDSEYRHYPVFPRRDRVFARMQRWLDIAVKENIYVDKPQELKRQANQRLKAYMKKWPQQTPVSLYAQILSKTFGQVQPRNKVTDALHVDLEDLAPLIYIHDRLSGISQEALFDHVVIDEAQDFSPFQVAVLRDHCHSQSFTILGDLSQNIYAYQGIQTWSEFIDLFPEDVVGFFQLRRSYRSTMEIIEFANEVLKRSGANLTLAEPVFRSGSKVKVCHASNSDRMESIAGIVEQIKVQAVSSIALVTRTETEAQALYESLQTHGLPVHLVSGNQQAYEGGVSVIPIHMTKGLEFDAVVLIDVDADHYPKSTRNALLLYVGCTRALHSLWLLTTETPSALISDIHPDFYETCETSTP